MSGRPILAAGRELTHWLRQGGRPARGARSLLWLYRWRALWLEQHYSLIQSPAGPVAKPTHYPEGKGLVFILGFWRSGTTLLHELLSEAPNCDAPRTWQCMDPSALLLPGRTSSKIELQRPMDEVVVSADSPQEDEFALMAMGVPSIYRGFLDPRRLQELEELLDPGFWNEPNAGWLRILECFLSSCSTQGMERMIVKSPNHLFRYSALSARYPKARFIWILRSPQALWRSNLNMWRAMVERYGLWNAPDSDLASFITKALAAYGDQLENLHRDGFFRGMPVLSYESLVADPDRVMSSLTDRLDIAPWATWGREIRTRVGTAQVKPTSAAAIPPSTLPGHLMSRLESLHETLLAGR